MDLAVTVLWLADPAVGQRVAGVVRVHAEVEVVTRVGHGELVGGARRELIEGEREKSVKGAKPCETNRKTTKQASSTLPLLATMDHEGIWLPLLATSEAAVVSDVDL